MLQLRRAFSFGGTRVDVMQRAGPCSKVAAIDPVDETSKFQPATVLFSGPDVKNWPRPVTKGRSSKRTTRGAASEQTSAACLSITVQFLGFPLSHLVLAFAGVRSVPHLPALTASWAGHRDSRLRQQAIDVAFYEAIYATFPPCSCSRRAAVVMRV